MKYGFIITSGDPSTVAELAREVEESGWDGAFYWDGIYVGPGMDVYDPWVVMAAMAMRTERVRIGSVLTPPTRRRPWKLARETITLDHLSNGRLVLPFGLGAVDAFGDVGEITARKARAERLDESLDILRGLWTGEPFSYSGRHFEVGEMTFRPKPVQSPGVPIWVVGAWPSEKSMSRATRCDGIMVAAVGGTYEESLATPDTVRAVREYAAERRDAGSFRPFDIIVEGETKDDEQVRRVAEFAEAGATWWLESPWTPPNDPETLRKRIRQGPPEVDYCP